MIVLPNSYEHYLSALRIYISLSILKHGLMPRHLENLRKILLAEAFYHKDNIQNVDVYKLCTNLLSAVKTKKSIFNFRIFANKTHCINKQLFSLLLLYISIRTNYCEIKAEGNNLILKTNTAPTPLNPLISALGGYCFYEIKQSHLLIVIPAEQTREATVNIESEWEYIFDKFSLVNLFFSTDKL